MVTHVTPATLVVAVKSELDDVWDQVSDSVDDSLTVGKEQVQEYISTRGTAKSGKEGRIETAKMLKSVRRKKLRFNKSSAEGLFGLGNGPEYSLFQEKGFRHYLSGQWVEGMFAVTDARDVVLKYLRDRIRSVK